MKKLALLLLLLTVAIAFFALDLDRLLTLEGIKTSQQRFAAMLVRLVGAGCRRVLPALCAGDGGIVAGRNR